MAKTESRKRCNMRLKDDLHERVKEHGIENVMKALVAICCSQKEMYGENGSHPTRMDAWEANERTLGEALRLVIDVPVFDSDED